MSIATNALYVSMISLGLAAPSTHAALLLNEDFESYANTAALQGAWLGNTSPAGPTLITAYDPAPTPLANQSVTKNARLNSVVAYRGISSTTGVDWSLKVELASEAYARSQAFGVLDANGVNGYLVRWNTTNVDQNSGNGLLILYRRGDSANTPYTTANRDQYTGATGTATGAQLSGTVNAGHPVTGFPVLTTSGNAQNNATYGPFAGFADIELRYTAATSRLDVYVNSAPTPLISLVDSNVTSFGRVYLSGHAAGVFDNVSFTTVPEPASALACGLAALLLGTRRRR